MARASVRSFLSLGIGVLSFAAVAAIFLLQEARSSSAAVVGIASKHSLPYIYPESPVVQRTLGLVYLAGGIQNCIAKALGYLSLLSPPLMYKVNSG